MYSKGTVKVEKVSDLSREDSWIVEKCDVTVQNDDIIAKDTNEIMNNIHANESSSEESDNNELESSDTNEPVVKKIKLVGT